MFVRKFVEKASKKYAGNGANGLKAEDLHPHIAFHYGIPSGSSSMAYDSIQQILAIATNDGRIKLFGRENTQAILQSDDAVPSKFLQFFENQGILLNVNSTNNIEVWDVDARQLCHFYMFDEEITSFSIIQRSLYMYVGTCVGDISILKVDQRQRRLLRMQYRIPFTESYGNVTESCYQIPVSHILPQPMAETRRVLIIFRDGLLSLWGIQESKTLFTGGSMQLSSNYETREVMSACWACTFGSKVAVGYSNGDLFIWSIPVISDKHASVSNKKEIHAAPNIPLLKLNLGYKMDKIPITSLRWVVSDGRASHLYINGFSESGASSFQVIILNDNSESRTIKLALPLTEPCLGMEIMSSYNDGNKQKKDPLVLLLKSGHLCLYIESEIETSLLKCQSKSTPSFPNHTIVKLPYYESRITAAKLCGSFSSSSGPAEEDNIFSANKFPPFLSSADKRENLVHFSTRFEGFAKTKRLYITGHLDGAINFWDASFPILLLMLTIKPQQSEEGNASSSSSVTALHFNFSSQIVICGDQSGLVRIISFKKELLSSDNMFSLIQAKLGANYIIQNIRLKGAILSLGINTESKRLAVGTDKGYVFVIDIKGGSILYQKQFPTQIHSGTISLQFENCNHNGYLKNVLLIATEDSSVIAVEEDTGNDMNSNGVHTKKPSKCLLMHVLDILPDGVCTAHFQELNQEKYDKDKTVNQSLILLCSEKAVRVYSLNHAVQGVKKLHCKKRLSGHCCFASVVSSTNSSEIGLALLFSSGKLEIRSLPDLTLLKEMTVRGFTNSATKSWPSSNSSICCSSEGDFIMANGDQEIFFLSIFPPKAVNRSLESISKVYKRGLMQQESFPNPSAHKEKKNKGLFGMVAKGSKSKNKEETVPEIPCASTIEDLSTVFSTTNFQSPDEIANASAKNEENAELDINDIDLDDAGDKPKGLSFPALNKQNLGKKLQGIRGMLMAKPEEKSDAGKEKIEDEKSPGTVDQIKKKYGYSTGTELSAPSIAKDRLKDNSRKLQDTGARSSEMHDTARSFSSMARELLRLSQK